MPTTAHMHKQWTVYNSILSVKAVCLFGQSDPNMVE